jgi:predicted methyltransferase
MAAVMTFTGVEPGDKVLELVPGSGYWTRMFSAIVGPEGHVYTVWPDEFANESYANWQKLVATPHYANVSLLKQPIAELDVPAQLDLVYTSQNYHDYQNRMDIVAFNIKVYEALNPGGLYVIIDHVASAGSGASDTDTLHRIDPALVRKDVEAAGFVFGGANDALRNRDDPHTVSAFDDSIRGHTDQFTYRFRKPAQ